MTCGRLEKQAKETGENLNLEKRKKEKMPARRKNSSRQAKIAHARFHTPVDPLNKGGYRQNHATILATQLLFEQLRDLFFVSLLCRQRGDFAFKVEEHWVLPDDF